MNKIKIKLLSAFLMFAVFASAVTITSCSAAAGSDDGDSPITVGIAWRSDAGSEFYTNIVAAFQELNVRTVMLRQVRNNVVAYTGDAVSQTEVEPQVGYLLPEAAEALKGKPFEESNAKDVLKDVDAVVFTGGEDVSPTLLRVPESWHGIEAEKDYNATRDVSDYTLMSYCIAKDVSTIGFCRGMQMLGIVAGASVIQDIPTYFRDKGETYDYVHRNEKQGDAYRDYAPHDVTVESNTILSEMTTEPNVLRSVPSWHHQSLRSVDATPLRVSGYTTVNGERMIEAIEHPGCQLVMGLQFHPEAAIVKWQVHAANAPKFMSKDEALKIFRVFVDKVRARKVISPTPANSLASLLLFP